MSVIISLSALFNEISLEVARKVPVPGALRYEYAGVLDVPVLHRCAFMHGLHLTAN